ncbi:MULTISPECIES: phosphonate ABC transporter substrate-binding protein [Shewanella]|uniref:Selenate ABC transporter substrate-binding protein n=1 Tax=Shewanella algae TaxID=38313 RepID=A0AAD1NP19_9GAMM|nr:MULTISPECIES: phosphonate ABC transporter substrate-binding protein [Shewanella]MBO2554275.1 phosphonate ABC transporter substrate-binding protein [Shewanella algae]MBO2558521.1 phosphonate ABC transporter substrate-binding protein [Shewanella algae]MBO2571192.1 phosphonate ABC transporter substrate-binding protein [Shewanella algae]MBO2575457.1 phosphonate ABC transporter substrate-binding protein [Shewanella algae]MBO2579824.1 phosphonate ABC transporter substrate-binding protein [Shewane
MNKLNQLLLTLSLTGAALFSQSALALESLKIALIPSEDSRAMIKQSQALMDELGKQLGVKVEGFVATDYNGVIEALRAKHIDIAYLGPFSYVKATQVTDVEAFVVAETKKKGAVAYHSQIIARADSDIKDIQDLKGKDFAFVDPTSTSGYVFPMVGLKHAGIEPKDDFANLIYTGAHDANILAVKNRRVDAATVADRILSAAVDKGMIGSEEYRVVWRSPAIPESPMVWRKDLAEEDKQKIRTAFLSLKNLQFGDQGEVNRYVATDDAAYDVVREAAKLARQ